MQILGKKNLFIKYHFDFFRKKYFFHEISQRYNPGRLQIPQEKDPNRRRNNETARIFLNLRINNLFYNTETTESVATTFLTIRFCCDTSMARNSVLSICLMMG